MSLCFFDAFLAKQGNNISEEEYWEHLFAHMRGVRHPDDNKILPPIHHQSDPFGFLVRSWALLRTYHSPIADVTPFLNVLKSYRKGDYEEMQVRLNRVEDRFRKEMRGSLAMLALTDRCSTVLKDCLEGEFLLMPTFIKVVDEAEVRNDDPETTKVIRESRIRKSYGPPKMNADGSVRDRFADETKAGKERAAKVNVEAFDIGGKLEVPW